MPWRPSSSTARGSAPGSMWVWTSNRGPSLRVNRGRGGGEGLGGAAGGAGAAVTLGGGGELQLVRAVRKRHAPRRRRMALLLRLFGSGVVAALHPGRGLQVRFFLF